jgi:hypothetical protein
MKRRDFIKTTILTGAAGVFGNACSTLQPVVKAPSGPGFDIHPFVKSNPRAVFVQFTNVDSKKETKAIHDTACALSHDLIVPVETGGYPRSTRITVKPNWTATQQLEGKPIYEILGVNTDPNFVEGFIHGIQKTGAEKFYIRECANPPQWGPMGYRDLADRNGIDLRDLSSKHYYELKDGDIFFAKVPDGVMFKEFGYMAPMNEPGTFLVNIAKMKAHGMGITASVKNLQGTCGHIFHTFCHGHRGIRQRYGKRYSKFLHKDFEQRIEELYVQHMKDGIPRWDRPGTTGGIWMESWVQRMLDSYSVTPTALNMVEGVYSQDGNGFGTGPHEKLGPWGATSRDYMSNIVIFGIDAMRVDIITHWLGGHEPGNLGLFHIAIERGMNDVLDPRDIPLYVWKDGQATPIKLEELPRTPLVTYYLQRDYNGQSESNYHLVDEPFDYSAWKKTSHASLLPSLEPVGRDRNGHMVMKLTLQKKGSAVIEAMNKHGDIVWKMVTEGYNPGVHQIMSDRFAERGIYNFLLKQNGIRITKQLLV